MIRCLIHLDIYVGRFESPILHMTYDYSLVRVAIRIGGLLTRVELDPYSLWVPSYDC